MVTLYEPMPWDSHSCVAQTEREFNRSKSSAGSSRRLFAASPDVESGAESSEGREGGKGNYAGEVVRGSILYLHRTRLDIRGRRITPQVVSVSGQHLAAHLISYANTLRHQGELPDLLVFASLSRPLT